MQSLDPDAQLMLAFRDGDEEALSALYRRWAGPVQRFLERMVRERATAEELMQETFVRVHGARDRYAADARFSTWLFRIARNLALNELDRARNKSTHLSADVRSRDDEERPALTLVAGGASVDELVHARRERERLEGELAALPERQRTALWLSAVEGHSYAEIAEVLEASPQSVKALIHRARARLADRLHPAGDAAGETAAAPETPRTEGSR
ncbi:MAG: sigma-70 family RNA polymerase sigma factor [Myxococcota bacterium]